MKKNWKIFLVFASLCCLEVNKIAYTKQLEQQVIDTFRNQTQQAIQGYDFNRNGLIEPNELIQIFQQWGSDWNSASQMANTVFQQLDTDHNGYITIEDFQQRVFRRHPQRDPSGSGQLPQENQSNIPAEVQTLFDNIEQYVRKQKSHNVNVNANIFLENLSKRMNEIKISISREANMLHSSGSHKMGAKYETAANMANIAAVGIGSLQKFESNAPALVISGTLDLIGAVAGLAPPPYGTATSAVCSLASFLCSMFNDAPSPEQTQLIAIGKIVEQKLADVQDQNIRSKIARVIQALHVSIRNIYSQSVSPVYDHITSYHIEQHTMNFLGSLSSYIGNILNTDKTANIGSDRPTLARTLGLIY